MITIRARNATSIFASITGLMFAKKIEPIYFTTRFGVHTFFIQEPIDLVILDEKNSVQVIKQGLKPFRIFLWNPIFYNVLELPRGSIEKMNIKKGTHITINLI